MCEWRALRHHFVTGKKRYPGNIPFGRRFSAVHTFNSGGLTFRAELFIVTAIIAWTYLLHAWFKREASTIGTRKKKAAKKLSPKPLAARINIGSYPNASNMPAALPNKDQEIISHS
jgi:hypothetical protein